jgi:beta-carotene 3-hydroxylase
VTLPTAVVVAIVAFVLMEPVTALMHRFVMHGIGRGLHRSHHRPDGSRFEANDWFPVMFGSIVMLGLWAGFNLDGLEILVPVGVGITAYGIAYALVHDGWIHRRVGWFTNHRTDGRRVGTLDHLAAAHRIHHEHNGAPFGMLFPVVPRQLRDRPVDCNSAPARF